ncbi:hypothetical protein HO173_011063 [Letharia columbiana]|uniref:SAM-dependent MTase RsmB/NOP-type domain-containing protein n=1 Tax=Letharia columbiana TaxID=112416 RepID=A0A8H6FLG1_9LECA|nr:uncharacterized protein HO173_011063 [Letharia columbiana]KAF6230711.1 hypothetical protein HO173_011063 [Letharia columbiana]
MSLYYDAAPLLLPNSDQAGSLKSRVFNSKGHKSPPKQIFALVTEASKWSPVLSEVIEKSRLLQFERKLTPNLALLLVHDLLLAKRGISAPSSHPLRLAVERHKARLHAELTKARLRKGLSSIEVLRERIEAKDGGEKRAYNGSAVATGLESEAGFGEWPHPRWVRVNTIKSDLDEQLKTTFAGYKTVQSLEELLRYHPSSAEKLIHVDKHVPNLLALPPATDLSKTPAYLNGHIILQDKASCFPAYLLCPKFEDGGCLDACAAPGNKTTHLAAILHDGGRAAAIPNIYAYERDKGRASTLLTLLQTAGAQDHVIAKVGQDFLRTDPAKTPWDSIGTLLLDPSCSGSGIVGRDETLNVLLPSKETSGLLPVQSKKRKRKPTVDTTLNVHDVSEEIPIREDKPSDQLSGRLTALSTFQLKLLLHAFHFPKARRITYSTCSLYAEENEHVVMKALRSSIAQERGWQILRREEQICGMKMWKMRGKVEACIDIAMDEEIDMAEIAEACIRCEKGTKEGTQGFFVAGFVRQVESPGTDQLIDQEWEGFSDSSSAP